MNVTGDVPASAEPSLPPPPPSVGLVDVSDPPPSAEVDASAAGCGMLLSSPTHAVDKVAAEPPKITAHFNLENDAK